MRDVGTLDNAAGVLAAGIATDTESQN